MRKHPESFSDILTMEYRWPRKGDRLLRASNGGETTASFAPHSISRNVFIWDGYMTAGAALIDEAQRRPHDRNLLLYPILFNYRHGLEAAMKWTIEMYGTPANISVGSAGMNHNLWALWKKCKAILRATPSSGDDAALKAVEQIVKDFHDIDKSAVAFRYSETKSGRTILLPDKPVDLKNLQQVMEAVDNFFTGTDGLLSDLYRI
jgi:hypothetical protein